MPSGRLNIKFNARPYRLLASPAHYQHQAVFQQLQRTGGVVSGTLKHGTLFSLTGSSFGTKTNPAPSAYDDMSGAVGTFNTTIWNSTYNSPQGQTPAVNNIQLQLATFNQTGFSPGAPDPFQSKIYAGCHLDLSNPYNSVVLSRTMPTPGAPGSYPFPVYWRYKKRYDPNSHVDPRSDNNRKDFWFSQTPTLDLGGNDNLFYGSLPANTSCQNNAIRSISNGNPATVSVAVPSGSNPLAVGRHVTFFGMPAGWTSLNGQSFAIASLGGSNNQWTAVLTGLNTSGLPSWPVASPGNGFFPVTNITQGSQSTTPAKVFFTASLPTNPCAVGTVLAFENITTMTQVNKPTGLLFFNVTAVGGTNPNYNVTIDADTTGFTAFGAGTGSVFFGFAPTPLMNADTTAQFQTDGGAQPPSQPMFQTPTDANGHQTAFWNQTLNLLNPANGWTTREYEMGCQTATGFNGGYFTVWDNRTQVMSYVGKTMNASAGGGAWSNTNVIVTAGSYGRDRGVNNFDYFGGPMICDIGEVGQSVVPRVMVGDAPSLVGCTVLEYAPATSWSNTAITAKFYQGNLVTGTTGYVYVWTGLGGAPTVPTISFPILSST